MNNFRMVIEYDGSRYSGWEAKEGRETIEGKLEAVLERLCNTRVKVIGAGRTDAGVHAKGMTANVHLELCRELFDNLKISDALQVPDAIKAYLNRYLPEDICIRELDEVPERFHARYNVIGKNYCYTCYFGDEKPVFDRKYVYRIFFEPDIDRMRIAAAFLTGEKDFAAFCGNAKLKKSTVRRIDRIDIEKNGPYIHFSYHGNGFLQYQIRIMTGTLLEVGRGNIKPEAVEGILKTGKRENAGPTLPPQGLCLMKVEY